jgi:broad specificity phosphatase PhoE
VSPLFANRPAVAEQVLIRHARAGSRSKWQDDDRLRPLTKKGRREADALVKKLEDIPLERVMSSPYVRCLQTVEPLSRARGLPPEQTEALAEGAGLDAFRRLLREHSGEPTAFCAHGDLMYDVSADLVEMGLVAASEAGYDKGAAWILEETDGRIVGARYLPVRA